jgi:excinuclease ABC subunit C
MPAPRAKFAYPPNLVVVDGGQPQVNAAARALAALGIDDVYVVGLGKSAGGGLAAQQRLPGHPCPGRRRACISLQRIRDEAHRFAITFHRQKRGKAMTVSALDGVPGLGEAKRKALVAHFGSLKKIKAALWKNSPPPRASGLLWLLPSFSISVPAKTQVKPRFLLST